MSIQLTVMSLDFESSAAPFTRVFEKEEITLGRLPGNDLVLDKPEISGYHASLRVKTGEDGRLIFIKDLGSSNGTMVENSPLRAQSEVTIEPNQRIIIGNFLIKPSILESNSPQQETVIEDFPKVTPISDAMEKDTEQIQSVEFAGEQKRQGNGTSISFAQMFQDEEVVEKEAKVEPFTQRDSAAETIGTSTPAFVPTGEEAEELTITVKVGDSDLENINFLARKLVSLEGKILHKGQPLVGVSVADSSLGTCISDANGHFSLGHHAENQEYTLSFEKQGYAFESISGSLQDFGPEIECSACKLVSIKGRIMRGTEPLAGVSVDGGTELGTTVSDADGYYCFNDVREDAEYTLKVSKANYLVSKD